MNCKVEKTENANEVKLEITVEAEKFENAMKKVYFQNAKYINIPGFRKGKAPMNIVEKYYGAQIFYEDAFNDVATEAYGEALEQNNIDAVSKPSVDIVQMEKGKDVIFTAVVQVKPEVKLGKYKGIEIKKIEYPVEEKDIDNEIKQMQEKNSRLVTVEDRALENGDTATIDFEGFVDGVAFEGGKGENYPLTIGSGSFIPGFEEQLIGVEPEQEVEVKVTFPEDYHAEDLKGKDAVFKCTVHEIKAKELPELDDEFASEVSEFDTLEEYKADVEKKLREEKESTGKRAQEDQAVNAIIANAEMDLPEAMIETEARQMLDNFAQRLQQQGLTFEQYMQFTGMTVDKMTEEMRPQAEKRIKTRLVLEAIVSAENIEVSDERLDEEVAKMAEAYGMEVDKLKEYMGDREKEQMKLDMAVQDAITFVVENAVVK